MPANPRSLEVTERYRSGMVGLRRRGQAEAKRVWANVRPADLDGTFAVGKLALSVATLQREAARLSSAYLASFLSSELGEATKPPPVHVYTGTFNEGPLREGLRSAPIAAKVKIGEGMDPAEATRAARAILLIDVGLFIDTAARESLRQGMDDDPRIEGYQRAIKGTCAACMGAAEGSTLPAGTPLEIHPGCQCVSEPVLTASSKVQSVLPPGYSQPVDEALAAVDAKHAYPSTSGRTEIVMGETGNANATLLPTAQGKVARMTLARGKVPNTSTVLHEMGHRIDTALGYDAGGETFLSMSADDAMAGALKTIRKSQAFQDLGAAPLSGEVKAYLQNPKELFARAYAQWTGKGEIAQADVNYGMQWASEDFAPVRKALEDLFRSKGLLHE